MTKYEKGPDRGPSHINRNWPVFAPTSWLVLSPTLTAIGEDMAQPREPGADGFENIDVQGMTGDDHDR
jgi:hypothetical protein